MAALPQPVTTADTYLAAIHDELAQIKAQLVKLNAPNTPAAEPGAVEIKEPAKPKPRARRKAAPKKAS